MTDTVKIHLESEFSLMYTVGIDLGGTNIVIGLCDEELNIVDKIKARTHAKRDGKAIVSDMARLTEELILRNSLTLADVEYVGIATPGIVDADRGIVVSACNLPFCDFPLEEAFRELLPVERVFIGNDANVAALAESLIGAAKGTSTSVTVTLGTGVGGGIILGGRIFSGGLNSGGAELGHTVIRVGGRPCACGRRGCVESYCSATALGAITKERMEKLRRDGKDSLMFEIAEADGKVGARTAFKAMKRGDAEGRKIVDAFIKNLAAALTDIVHIFQPEVITVGGGVSNEGDALIIPLAEAVDREQYTRNNKVKTRIVRAKLGTDAGIVGAAGLGRQFVYQPCC